MTANDDTRTRILNAAGEAFAERGFQGATVRDICRVAGANIASVNYYFGDKERLYSETLRYAARLRNAAAPPPDLDADTAPEVKLREHIRAMVQRMLTPDAAAWHAKLMLREVLQPTGACRELVEEFIRPHFKLLLSILDEMLPEDTAAHERHQLGFSVVGQCLFYRFHQEVIDLLVSEAERREHYSPEQLADHITNVTLAALGRRCLCNPTAAGRPSPPAEIAAPCKTQGFGAEQDMRQ